MCIPVPVLVLMLLPFGWMPHSPDTVKFNVFLSQFETKTVYLHASTDEYGCVVKLQYLLPPPDATL